MGCGERKQVMERSATVDGACQSFRVGLMEFTFAVLMHQNNLDLDFFLIIKKHVTCAVVE